MADIAVVEAAAVAVVDAVEDTLLLAHADFLVAAAHTVYAA